MMSGKQFLAKNRTSRDIRRTAGDFWLKIGKRAEHQNGRCARTGRVLLKRGENDEENVRQ